MIMIVESFNAQFVIELMKAFRATGAADVFYYVMVTDLVDVHV